MNASRLFPLTLAAVACCLAPAIAWRQVPSADDFLPPVSGGTTDVKQPYQVAYNEQAVTAATAQDAINAAVKENVQEMADGDTPEVGAKMVKYPSGLGFVGFGSAVVTTSTNNAVQLRQNLAAQKVASMRAKDALCGLIIGDRASWEGSVVESMKDQVQEFESLAPTDPLARRDPTAVRKFDEARQAFVARMETNDAYQSARRGILPPGINTKTWFDEDNAWVYAMSVYVPSLTNAAAGAGRDVRDSAILQPVDDSRMSSRRGSLPTSTSSSTRYAVAKTWSSRRANSGCHQVRVVPG